MIPIRQREFTIAEALKAHLDCEVVSANQNCPIPDYPYVSYTIITLMTANNGTWSEYEDGTKQKEVQQIWSFTAHADNDTESQELAISASDFFDELGTVYLNDNGIVVQRIGNITNRDNFITTGYEYRNGFDVTFTFMNVVKSESSEAIESIESVSLGDDIEADRTIEGLNESLEKRLDGDLETESTLEENVKQAISDFNEIEKALAENGIKIPEGVDTKDFADFVRELGNSVGTVTLTKYTKADIKDGES